MTAAVCARQYRWNETHNTIRLRSRLRLGSTSTPHITLGKVAHRALGWVGNKNRVFILFFVCFFFVLIKCLSEIIDKSSRNDPRASGGTSTSQLVEPAHDLRVAKKTLDSIGSVCGEYLAQEYYKRVYRVRVSYRSCWLYSLTRYECEKATKKAFIKNDLNTHSKKKLR